MTMSSAPPPLQWELESLGNIPREVVSILLGSIPVVPDPRLEAQVLESAEDRSRLEDRLSEDDDEESDGMDSPQHQHLKDETMSVEIIKDDYEDDDSAGETTSASKNPTRKKTTRHDRRRGDEDGALSENSSESKPWNIPDDDWAWSDEESMTMKSKESTQRQPGGTFARGNEEDTQRRLTSGRGHTGLGLSGVQMGGRDDSTSSTPSRATPPPSSRGGGNGSGKGGSSASKPGSTSTAGTRPAKHEWKATHSHMTVAQDLKVSICDRGDYIVCASKKMFAILNRTNATTTSPPSTLPKDGRPGWVLIGQGSGLDGPSDCITSVLCLPLYTPKSRQSQIYVVVGYHTGIIRIYNETGTLLVVQQLHHTPVVSLKARIGSGKVPGDDEDEMTIVHEGGRVVCIEGGSLWVALRMSNNQGNKSQERSLHAAQAPTFAYKKWHLQNQDHMVDVISCGPARHRQTLSNGFSSASSSAMYTAKATERFVAVGSKPMMVFYASSSSGRPLFSATSIASQVASRVTSAFVGFAKSIWSASPLLRPLSPAPASSSSSSSSSSTSSNYNHLSVPTAASGGAAGAAAAGATTLSTSTTAGSSGLTALEGGVHPTAMAPATEVPAILWLSDPQRCIRHVSLAPMPSRGSMHHYPPKMAAMTDSLGRVLLVDLEECEVIRMWKGLRGARCGWIQEEKLVPVVQRSSPHSLAAAPHDRQSLQPGQEQGQQGLENTKGQEENEEQGDSNKPITTFRRHLMLYLVIYAPKRGTAEIYPMRHGPREALLHVGLGWKVCTTSAAPIGQPAGLNHHGAASASGSRPSSPRISGSSANSGSGLVQCFLIGPSGEVRLIQRKPHS